MQTLLRCPYSLRVQLHESTSKTLAAIPLSGHRKMQHTLVGMGSAALAAAVPCPGKATRISRKGQKKSTKKIYFFNSRFMFLNIFIELTFHTSGHLC